VLLRNDDLDAVRFRLDFVDTMIADLRWLGLTWREPIITQSQRLPLYHAALAQLHAGGFIFPCHRSRRDVLDAIGAPHEGGANDEPVYPPAFRPPSSASLPPLDLNMNWRFRVPDGESVSFLDGACGLQTAIAGHHFGDFLVWRKDGVPSYQLACAVDDADLAITEVVRGADLIQSTFRQLLIIRALNHPAPAYYHCPLMLDATGARLAKRHDALSLQTLRAQNHTATDLVHRVMENLRPCP
jgi:glutamyl/glutaminyl-tRNA synthetase